jgi:glucose uptake protein
LSQIWGQVHANILLAALSVIVIIAGVLMIVFAGGTSDANERSSRAFMVGLMGAVGAGIGFGTYFVPIRISAVSMWVAVLPLAVGMFVGSCILAWVSHAPLSLAAPSHYGRVLATGFLWAIGNYGALKMMELIGTGRGFTIAQLCVVVNALFGIFWEKNPHPGTRAANFTLAGVVIATVGGCVLGSLKS